MLKQQALDYTLGVLPKEESLLFEARLENDEDAQKFLVEAQEDFAQPVINCHAFLFEQ